MKTESIRSEIARNKVSVEWAGLAGEELSIPFLHAHIWEKLADRLMVDDIDAATAALAEALVPEARGFNRTALHCLLAGVAGAAMRRGRALAREHRLRLETETPIPGTAAKLPPRVPQPDVTARPGGELDEI